MKHSALVTLLITGVVLSACADQPLEPDVDQTSSVSQSDGGAAALVSIEGEIGPGSTYEILVPDAWNGDLVLYAHGYVDPESTDPLTDAERDLLPTLPALGYAVAYSSFSENGLAVKDGAQRTKQLRGVFVSKVGQPERTYLIGGSMGGLIAVDLTERFPTHYDGALALCGMVGGTQAQIDYVAHVRVLFDAIYPGVLPGALFDNPSLTPAEVLALVTPALLGDPAGVAVLANVLFTTFGIPLPGVTADELAESIVSALAFDIRGFSDVLDRTHGHSPFDNSDVLYSGSPDDVALNLAVARFEARPDAVNYLRKYYEPTGALRIPVLTLHNQMDPLVPAFHEARLAAAAADAGYGGSLVQVAAAEPFGHCEFDPAEVFGAFGTLVAWVVSGVPPA